MAEPNRKKTKNKEDKLISENTYLLKEEDYQLHLAPDLTSLSLDELVLQYIEIDRQSKLLKGRVLLVIRSHFDSDKKFGQWVATHSLCVGSQQTRNRLMHLAEFFSGPLCQHTCRLKNFNIGDRNGHL